MKTKNEKQKFEFSLLINNNIICQRYIDIPDYNSDCRESLEIREMMDEIVGINHRFDGQLGIIPNFLKQASMAYLWEFYDPYKTQKDSDILVNNNTKNDYFQFEVKVDGEVVAKSGFKGTYFPTKVRYQVNIKEIIPDIVNEISFYMSRSEYTRTYGDITLNRLNKYVRNK